MTEWWPEERTRRLVELADQGMSMSKIALELGISRNAVAGRIYRQRSAGCMAPAQMRQPKARVRRQRLRITLSPHRTRRAAQIVRGAVIPRSDIAPLAVPMADLEPHQCRYVLDERRDGLAVFCGIPTAQTYCDGHAQFVYRRIT